MANAVQKIVIHADDKTASAIGSAIRNSKRLDKQLNTTSKNMRTMTRQSRAHFGQLGHQVQDVAVQLQMGMNPLMVFGQQGSQVASIFGAKGAMIGGLIAVSAVLGQQLAPAFFSSAKGAKELVDEIEGLSDVLDVVDGKLVIVDKALAKAFEDGDTEAGIVGIKNRINELMGSFSDAGATIESQLEDALDQSIFSEFIDGFDAIQEAAKGFSIGGPSATATALKNIDVATKKLAERYGVAASEAREFATAAARVMANATPENMQELSDITNQFALNADSGQAELLKMAVAIHNVSTAVNSAKEQIEGLQGIESGGVLPMTEDQLKEEEALLDLFEEQSVARYERSVKRSKEEAEKRKNALKEVQDALVKAANTEFAILQRGAVLTREAMTPREQLNAKFKEYQGLLDNLAITQETFDRLNEKAIDTYRKQIGAINGVNDALSKVSTTMPDHSNQLLDYAKAAGDTNKQLENVAMKGVTALEDSLVGLVSGTMSAKDAFKNMAASIIQDMIRMQIQQNVTGLLAGALGGLFGFQSSGLAGAQSFSSRTGIPMATGARANGGPVGGNRPYVVGERGPELMIPNGSGRVVSNEDLSSGGVTVVQNINVSTGVQQTVRTEIANLMPQIANASKQAVLDARRRGGSFATAFGA